MVTIVGGIQRIAGQAAGDMHQQQRLIQAAIARHAKAGHRLRQAFGQMEKHLRLEGIRQMLALVIDADLHAAGGEIVAQLRMIATVDKHQSPGVQRQRQRVTLFGADRRSLIGDEAAVKQRVQRGVFPVLLLARRQTQAQQLLQMLAGLRRTLVALRFKQMVPLLQRITAVR